MFDEEYKEPANKNDVWINTSRWKPTQLEILRVTYTEGKLSDIVGNINLEEIVIDQDSERLLLPDINIDISSVRDMKNIKQIPFFNRLKQLSKFSDEPPVDSIAYDLLNYTGFESEYIHYRPKPHLEITWRDHEISSEADYGVFKGLLEDLFVEYMLIIEDKSYKAKVYQNGECQLFGEMLLAAHNNLTITGKGCKIYGIIIRGYFVKFYVCEFSEQYIRNIYNDKLQTIKINPIRYSKNNQLGLSLKSYSDRQEIVKIMTAIRDQLIIPLL